MHIVNTYWRINVKNKIPVDSTYRVDLPLSMVYNTGKFKLHNNKEYNNSCNKWD